jgi:hypothetical protein
LEWLAEISPRHAEELARLKSAEAAARSDRELLHWAARFSSHAEEKLRSLDREEAAAGDSLSTVGKLAASGDEIDSGATSSWLDEWQEPDLLATKTENFGQKGAGGKAY